MAENELVNPNPVFNAQTREQEQPENLEQAIAAGTHGFQAGSRVNVINPNGETVSVPAEQVKDAVSQGYKIESPEQFAVRSYVDKNKNFKGAATVALSGALDELAFGIPGLIYEKTKDPLAVAKYEALKKEYAGTNAAARIAGFVGSLFTGAPLFKGAAAAGKAVTGSNAARALLAKVGVDSASQSAARAIVSKATEKAIEMGVEGALIASPRAITEAALAKSPEDFERAGETLLIGGGIGAGLGIIGGLGSGIYSQVTKAANKVAAQKDIEALRRAGQPIPDELWKQAGGEYQKSMSQLFKERLTKPAENAAAIREAADRQGIQLHAGVLEGDQLVRESAAHLPNRPTVAGAMFRNDVEKTFSDLQRVADDAIGKAEEGATASQVGEKAKQSLIERVGADREYFAQEFDRIGERTGQMPVAPEIIEKHTSGIRSGDVFNMESLKGVRGSVEALIKDLEAAGDVRGVAKVATIADSQASAAYRAGNYDLYNALRNVKSAARDIEEAAISDGVREMGLRGAEGKKAAEILKGERDALRAKYSDWKKQIQNISETLKIGRGSNQASLAEGLAKVDAFKLSKKLFSEKNPGLLAWTAKNMPSEFEQLRKVFLQDLREEVTKDGTVQIGRLTSKVQKLEPEAAEAIFGKEGVQKLMDLKTVHEALPAVKFTNTSRTSYATAFGEIFTPKGLANNANDAALYNLLKGREHFEGLLHVEQALKKVAEKLDTLPQALESVGSKSSGDAGAKAKPAKKAPRVIPRGPIINSIQRLMNDDGDSRDALEKLKDKAAQVTTDPAKSADLTGAVAAAFANTGAPKIAEAMQMKMVNAFRHLQDSMPKAKEPDYFGKSPYQPSDYELAQFNRRLEVMLDPLSVIDRLKDNTLTKVQVDTLREVYPQLYTDMTKRVLGYLTENRGKMDYTTRLKVSVLLGAPLEKTLRPDAVSFYQGSFHSPDMEAQIHQSEQLKPMNLKNGIADRASGKA